MICGTISGVKPLKKEYFENYIFFLSDKYTETEKVVCSKADRQNKCPNVVPSGMKYTLWGEWGACTSPCNGNRRGTKTRMRICLTSRGCNKKKTVQTRKCESTCNPEGKNLKLLLTRPT